MDPESLHQKVGGTEVQRLPVMPLSSGAVSGVDTLRRLCVDHAQGVIEIPSMRSVLQQVEGVLPELLDDERGWSGLKIVRAGTLSRLHRRFGNGFRVFLHRVDPCFEGQPFYHYHQWPMIVKVLEGAYEMGIGAAGGSEAPSIICAIKEIRAPFQYEMPNKNGWHYTRALGDQPTWSLAIIGEPWDRPQPYGATPEVEDVLLEEKRAMLAKFRSFYPKG